MDLLQLIEVFTTVAETSSFTKTADALQTTRPTVTNAVQSLEAMLGTRLLHRTTRRTNLTAEGALFYDRAVQILADVSEAKSLFVTSDMHAEIRGRLRIDLPVLLAKALIIPNLRDFSRKFPHIELVVGVSDAPTDLIAEGIDCVVRIGDLQSSSMVGRRIGHVPMVTCASPEYLKEHGRPSTLDDLQRHRAVTFFSGKNRKILDWTFVEDEQEIFVKPRSGIMVNDSDAFVASGVAGFGLMQAIGISVSQLLEAGELEEVLPNIQPKARPVSVMYPNRKYLAPQVRVFVNWVTELFDASQGRWLTKP